MGTRIYIGRLNYDVRERDIEKFFKGYGRIREILLKNGFGFVEFDDYRDADDAVYELNGKELLGERVTIEHARGSPRGSDMYSSRNRGYSRNPMQRRRPGGPRDRGDSLFRYGPPARTEYRLVVENLSSGVSWQLPTDLKDYMRQAGEVTYADAHKQRRNEGVVEFASFSDMKNALEKLDDTDLNGRRIRLTEDKSARRSSRRSRSRSKSSRSRSRSKSHRSSRSKSRSKSKSRSRSRSRSESRSRSKSASPRRDRSRSRSVSKERSKQSHSKSRSRSVEDKDNSPKPESKADDASMDDKE